MRVLFVPFLSLLASCGGGDVSGGDRDAMVAAYASYVDIAGAPVYLSSQNPTDLSDCSFAYKMLIVGDKGVSSEAFDSYLENHTTFLSAYLIATREYGSDEYERRRQSLFWHSLVEKLDKATFNLSDMRSYLASKISECKVMLDSSDLHFRRLFDENQSNLASKASKL